MATIRAYILTRCRVCLGIGYKGRQRGRKWKIECCRACNGVGQKTYRDRRADET